jgi:hypothetical protein
MTTINLRITWQSSRAHQLRTPKQCLLIVNGTLMPARAKVLFFHLSPTHQFQLLPPHVFLHLHLPLSLEAVQVMGPVQLPPRAMVPVQVMAQVMVLADDYDYWTMITGLPPKLF